MGEKSVIDQLDWLRQQAEELLAARDPAAIDYLKRLLAKAGEPQDRFYCLAKIGLVHFRHGQIEESRAAFESAAEIDPEDPGVAYALGQCARSTGDRWRALMHFVEALVYGRMSEELPEYMRAIAVLLDDMGHRERSISLLLGALDLQPNSPAVLESLGRVYEHQQRWEDAIDARDALIELLKRTNQSQTSHRLFQPEAFDPGRVRAKIHAINDRMRRDIRLVGEESDLSWAFGEEEAGLARINLPAGLYTLAHACAARERNIPLLESVEMLWARAFHDRFDVYLKPQLLAAAIHWIVERLHWRIKTPGEQLEELYGFEVDRVVAAARLVASRFGVELFPMPPAKSSGHEVGRRLADLQNMLLYDAWKAPGGAIAMLNG